MESNRQPHVGAPGLANATVVREMVVMGVVSGAMALVCFLWLDRPIAWFVRDLPNSWHQVASELTEFGSMNLYGWALPVAVIACLLLRRVRDAWWFGFALAASLLGGLVVNIFKVTLGRGRPSVLYAYDDFGFNPIRFGYDFASFPSGHSATVGSLVAVLWLRFPWLWPLWILLGLAIPFTRIFTMSHYPSDVLVGTFVGVLTSLLLHRILVQRGVL